MVDFAFIRREAPSISFFFARLGAFLESSSRHHPQLGLFLPQDCGAFRPVLNTLYPLIRHSLITNYLGMTVVEYRDTDVRSSELDIGLSSTSESMDKDFEIVVLKPSSSSSSIPFHALSESCSSEQRHLKSIRQRFQFPRRVVRRLPCPNGKAFFFAHSEVSFYEATFLCGLHFPVHPFIMQLLSILNVAPGQIVPNAWRMIISYMSIWVSAHNGDMITLYEFLHLYHLKPSTHYRYFELFPWSRESRIVCSFPTSFGDWKS